MIFGVEFVLIYRGLLLTSASRAVVFLYTAPFFVAFGSYLFLGERLRASQWGGLALCFTGVALAIGVPQADVDAKVLLGDLLIIAGGALCPPDRASSQAHQAGHQDRVPGGRWTSGTGGRTVGRHVPGGVLQVLHPDRDAGQGTRVLPGGHPGVDGGRRRPGPVLVDRHEGVDRAVVGGHLTEGVVDEFGRRHLAAPDPGRQVDH